ncbi:MAG: CHRD domain-containing protein [Cytophagales bacterium]|nr:MAG: CHRD domain-containing protein [Cytophagales bacterium]
MKHTYAVWSALLMLAGSIFFIGCNDHAQFGPTAQIRLVANLSGSAERPNPVVSPGTGTFVGILDRSTRVLNYTVTYSGITPSAGHIHRINAANGNGPVEIPFANLGSPIIGTATLTTNSRVDSLINGFYYVNLHTPANPGGEIRGNVRVDGPIKLKATLSGAAERPNPVVTSASGSFAGVIDPTTRVLNYTVTYAGLTPSAGHLHRINAANGNGPVEIGFASLGSPIIGTATLTTSTRVDSLLNGFYYANLHTPAFPGGEIRGDIRP